MGTELREARVKIILDVEGQQQAAESLEDSTRRTRAEQEKAKREDERIGRGSTGTRRIALRQVAHGQIYRAVTEVIKSIPFGVGLGFAAGIGIAELNERFGPGIGAFLQQVAEEHLPDIVVKTMEQLGIDFNGMASASREWSQLKAELSSISEAFERTGQTAAAAAMTGGALSAGELKDEFLMQREMAMFQIQMLKDRRRIIQMRAGAGAADVLKKTLEETSMSGSVGK